MKLEHDLAIRHRMSWNVMSVHFCFCGLYDVSMVISDSLSEESMLSRVRLSRPKEDRSIAWEWFLKPWVRG